MDQTPNLHLPFILAAQAQKHVTHNEAIRALDALVQLSVLDRDLSTPPSSPADGARYIVATGATGAWAGQALRVAAFQDGAWAFFAPLEGWITWVADEDVAIAWNGTAWATLSGGGSGSVNPAPLVGVNATADTTNRLSVASPASLFNHEGAGHQVKVNKAAATNTASLLFQDAFSGRAEIGLAGDDDLHVKVSANGTTWTEAIVVNRATGVVSMPSTPATGGGTASNPNLLINGDFQINQRAFAGGALAAGVYGVDRWKADTGGASLSLAGYVVTLTSGVIVQPVEPAAQGFANLASAQMTVSLDSPSADVTVTLGSASGAITAGSGRRSVTLTTGAGDTGNLSLKLAKATAGTVTFGRVKLEIGAAATTWAARPFSQEAMLAWRYYYKNSASLFMDGFVSSGGYFTGLFTLPVQMRAVPTISYTVSQQSNVLAQVMTASVDNISYYLQRITTAGDGRTYGRFENITLTAEI